MIHAQLCLFFYLLITFLALQALFLTWRCWSVLASLVQFAWKPVRCKSHCVWCWDAWHIRGWYPERWSSTMCPHHRRAHTRQLQARRSARQTALPETLSTSCVSVSHMRNERVEPVEVLS
jgi:hypothetical protein